MNDLVQTSWNDKLGNRRRVAWCLLIKGDEMRRFVGDTIPGWAVVTNKRYRKDGVWSSFTYDITLGRGVRMVSGHQGWETNTFLEGLTDALKGKPDCSTWPKITAALGLSENAIRQGLAGWKEGVIKTLDQTRQALLELEAG